MIVFFFFPFGVVSSNSTSERNLSGSSTKWRWVTTPSSGSLNRIVCVHAFAPATFTSHRLHSTTLVE